MTTAVSTAKLGKRYGSLWALCNCNLNIEKGSVVALVGPNGAGKTTLLSLIMGLTRPTTGHVTLSGGIAAGSSEALRQVSFMAQEHPLYRRFRVRDLLLMGQKLNDDWDGEWAKRHLIDLDIPLDRPAGKLSGGQHAQVSLTMTLAKRAPVVLLDEPVAALDPLARRDFMALLMDRVAETGVTVILSSHVVSELERVCDYLVVLSGSEVQVAGDIGELIAVHRRLIGPAAASEPSGVDAVIQKIATEKQTNLLARVAGPIPDPQWQSRPVSLEDIVIAYLGAPDAEYLPAAQLSSVPGGGEQ